MDALLNIIKMAHNNPNKQLFATLPTIKYPTIPAIKTNQKVRMYEEQKSLNPIHLSKVTNIAFGVYKKVH